MGFITELSRQTAVLGTFDVIVVGAGPAGSVAALSAARCGSKVLLLEQSNAPGGMATTGLMSHWAGAHELPILNEIISRMLESTSLPPEIGEHVTDYDKIWSISHECLKTTLMQMLHEVGVTLQLHTQVTEPIMEGEKVKGVIFESKSGREAALAKIIIDASGDGDIAARAGAEYFLGREADQRNQPVTLMFLIGGVDYARAIFPGSFESYMQIPKGEVQALGKKNLPHPAGHVLLYGNRLPGQVCVNMTNVTDIDGTNVRDLTKAEFICREQIDKIILFLREFVPGYEKCYLTSVAGNVGVRETRHFKGLYTVTGTDIVEARVFPDWIATRNFFNFDIHSLDGPGLDKHGAQKEFRAKGTYTIPYSACIPEKINGLLLAGRNISGTHKAHSNYRVMGICANIGQGIGVAATLAAKQNIEARDVQVQEVQKQLIEWGVEV